GFAPYEGQRGDRESACVAALRAAGMVIMGKTVTTQFACPVPRKTLNPHDPTRTPGVSSSGSAAAVADFMIPLANGSQTGGSVIGPSANCGVYGYKASLDGIDRGGFRHCKPSIDTIGLFARSVEDLILLRAVQTGGDRAGSVDRHHAVRVGLARTAEWERTEPCMRAAFERAARLLESAGADVRDVDLPQRFSDIVPDFAVVNGWESAKALDYEIRNHLDAFNAHNRNRVEFVRGLSAEDYQRAVKNLDAARREMHALISDYDIFISPSLPGEAPVGINEVHTSVFARLWTQMYTPSINLPLFVGPNGLPVCLQVIGPRDSDDATLAFAAWVDGRLREALGAVPAAAA
ncbi:MAG: amidase, partial [Alphaproteobacteria bacterium]|nr:amidase [Alphaproteobacteria bacterium]